MKNLRWPCYFLLYTKIQKFGVGKIEKKKVFKVVLYAHQCCIYILNDIIDISIKYYYNLK